MYRKRRRISQGTDSYLQLQAVTLRLWTITTSQNPVAREISTPLFYLEFVFNVSMRTETHYLPTLLITLFCLIGSSVNEIICHGIPDARWTIFLIILASSIDYVLIAIGYCFVGLFVVYLLFYAIRECGIITDGLTPLISCRPLEEGDIVNVDISVYLNGCHGKVCDGNGWFSWYQQILRIEIFCCSVWRSLICMAIFIKMANLWYVVHDTVWLQHKRNA